MNLIWQYTNKALFLIIITINLIFAQINVKIGKNLATTANNNIEIPVLVDDITGKNILAFQFKVEFDGNILIPLELITTGTLSQANNWIAMPNFLIKNEINVGAFGSNPLTGGGELIKIKFKVNGNPGDTTSIRFQSFMFNSGEQPVVLSNGLFTIKIPTSLESSKNNSVLITSTQNYPNPFNSLTKIFFNLSDRMILYIDIYDNAGKKIKNIFTGTKMKGFHAVEFNAENNPSGVYFYRISGDKINITGKMIYLR